ncbi:MAG: hypothetical protein PHV98_07290 [Candidatus Omnitrophica bacterium]|jgi:hypothetical protein|nr:hypothetical protein [Candidatus Omnitrophota bacterium]
MTRLQIIESILIEWRKTQDTFGLRQLAMEVESRCGHWVLEDTVRKEMTLLTDIPTERAGKGIRRFIYQPQQRHIWG